MSCGIRSVRYGIFEYDALGTTWIKNRTFVSHGGDLTNTLVPKLRTITAMDSGRSWSGNTQQIGVIFSEACSGDATGWSCTVNGTAITLSYVSGSGTQNWVMQLATTLHHGDVIRLTYDTATGATKSTSGLVEINGVNAVQLPDQLSKRIRFILCDSTSTLVTPVVVANETVTAMALEYGGNTPSYNGVRLDGAAGDYVSSPDSTALDITGDLEIIACINADDYTPAAGQPIVAKWNPTGNQRAYLFLLRATGVLRLNQSSLGTVGSSTSSDSTVIVPMAAGNPIWVKVTLDVDNGAAGNTVTFYWAASPSNILPSSSQWQLLGTPVVNAGTTTTFNSSDPLEIGLDTTGVGANFAGFINRVQIKNGIGGTIVADFNPTEAVLGAASFISSTGEVYTMNGTARIQSIGPQPTFGDLADRSLVLTDANGQFDMQYTGDAPVGGTAFAAIFRTGGENVSGAQTVV